MTMQNQNMVSSVNTSRPTINFLEKGKLKIKNFIMIETHTDYKDIYSRSININADNNAINGLKELMVSGQGNGDITSMEVANHLNGAASISSIPSYRAEIPNGWKTRRIRYMLAMSKFDGYTEDISYIQGYTEFSDPSISGYVDPNMAFYINSITSVIKTYDHNTGRYFVRPKRSFNVVSDMCGGYRYEEVESPDSLKLIRPVDVMNKIHVMSIAGEEFSIQDSTSSLNNATISARSNSDPSNYLAKTLNGFLEAKSSISNTVDMGSLYRNTLSSSFIREGKLLDDIFIRELYNITSIINPTSFTLNLLAAIDPDVNSKGVFINRASVYDHHTDGVLGTISDTAETHDVTPETVKSATILHSINSMLIDNMITKLSVAFTNETGPVPTITITNINSFIEDIDLISLENKVRQHIRSVLMPTITDNNYTAISAIVETDLLGDTNISISINHGPSVVYRYPAFADVLYSPVVSTTANSQMLVEDIANLMDATYLY